MDENFRIDKARLSDTQYEMLLKHKERTRNQWFGFGSLVLIVGGIVIAVLALTGNL